MSVLRRSNRLRFVPVSSSFKDALPPHRQATQDTGEGRHARHTQHCGRRPLPGFSRRAWGDQRRQDCQGRRLGWLAGYYRTGLSKRGCDAADPHNLIGQYRRLAEIEACFRTNKHDRRIRAHIALCYRTFCCVQHLRYRLAACGTPLSPARIPASRRRSTPCRSACSTKPTARARSACPAAPPRTPAPSTARSV